MEPTTKNLWSPGGSILTHAQMGESPPGSGPGSTPDPPGSSAAPAEPPAEECWTAFVDQRETKRVPAIIHFRDQNTKSVLLLVLCVRVVGGSCDTFCALELVPKLFGLVSREAKGKPPILELPLFPRQDGCCFSGQILYVCFQKLGVVFQPGCSH